MCDTKIHKTCTNSMTKYVKLPCWINQTEANVSNSVSRTLNSHLRHRNELLEKTPAMFVSIIRILRMPVQTFLLLLVQLTHHLVGHQLPTA